MNDKEEQIAFRQWVKDWGHQFPKTMSEDALWLTYRSMDLENRKEFLTKAKSVTDKEKAEEYVDKLLHNEKCSFPIGKEQVKKCILKVYLDALDCCKKSYEKGFAEGRKESAEENEQLKADLKEARVHCEAVDAVNEKMKCCGNCANASYEWGERVIEGKCLKCKALSEWELMK